jgi:hypothetical protein
MKNMQRHLFASTFLFLFLGGIASSVYAVVFSSDALYFYIGGKRIADNSIIVLYAQDGKEHLEVCEKGSFWLRQGPMWNPGPYTFVQTSHKDILTIEKWFATPEGKASKEPDKDYPNYLGKKIAGAPGRTEVKIPTIKESPALDRSPSPPPRAGMAEGKIGYDRFFRVDLQTGTITQTLRSEIFKDSGK